MSPFQAVFVFAYSRIQLKLKAVLCHQCHLPMHCRTFGKEDSMNCTYLVLYWIKGTMTIDMMMTILIYYPMKPSSAFPVDHLFVLFFQRKTISYFDASRMRS